MAFFMAAHSAIAGVREVDLVQKQKQTLLSFPPINPKAKGESLLGSGKVRLLLFWASWCPYCKQAIADLTPAYSQWLTKGAAFYVISIDETQASAETYLSRSPIRMPVWWGGIKAKKDFQISSLPTILILDDNNRILSEYAGYGGERYAYMKKRLNRLLQNHVEDE